MDVAPETVVHRVGGVALANLIPHAREASLSPPGVSVLMDGTPQEAAEQLRRCFGNHPKWQAWSGPVGTATVADIRAAGFDVIAVPSAKLPNHARLTHPAGIPGFSDANLTALAAAFTETMGC